MISGHLDAPYNLPNNALANLSFLYGGDRCQCNRCDRCRRRKSFASGFVVPNPDSVTLAPVPGPRDRQGNLVS